MPYLKVILFFVVLQVFFISTMKATCIENGVNTYGTGTTISIRDYSDITTPSNFLPTDNSIFLSNVVKNAHNSCITDTGTTDCNASGNTFPFTSFMKNQTVVTPSIDQIFSNLSAETTKLYNDGSTTSTTTNNNYNNLSVKLFTHITLQTQNNPLKIDSLNIDDINSSLYITSQNPYNLEIKTVNMGNAADTFLTLQNAQYLKTQVFNQAQDASVILPNIERIDVG